MATPLLFLSGAGLPSWIWDDVRSRVEAPSRVAPRPTTGETVSDYARAALEAAPAERFTLIVHSSGGVVAAELARSAEPGRITGVLGLAAVIPRAGASFVSSLPFPQRFILPAVMRVAGTRPPESSIRKGLGAGLDETTTRRLVADLSPEPREYFTSRAADPAALFAIPSRGYVVTTDDAEIPSALQRRFAARLHPTETFEVRAGHLPMLTHPKVIATAINSLGDRPGT
ncbi:MULTISPECIES: alpha/beta fold hydrolase [unclassified Nesterenkonia]|uniref:alpha/beta fold hydrolase n=1 Tax=unclassified Nesterenkonia TaxID=2629769 RepID=UPI001F4D141C|nr:MULTISPECIES: alpha/beta hydrolase [unclassified Nesterenkonia]MCH8560779.1 alpha/beta hydrolase [Nesterenkonia sp. DZ6]MCH8563612.1 alpha/beta hydrolase [Nesterenkonia sp. YGD6]MCH8570859.1 alpha/beta hydrolase [Nesterenkonia sp. AY15]